MSDQAPNGSRKPRKREKNEPVNLDAEAVLSVVDGAKSDLKLAAGEAVFQQGDAAEAVFCVRSGRVQLTVLSDQGKEGVIALFGPGEFFGEGCLAAQPIRLASAVATMPSEIVRIEKAGMARLLRDNHEFAEVFTAFLVSRNIQVEADLVDQLFNSSEKRLARLLLLMANFNNDGELRPIVPKISQEVLAARVGTTRSRINFFLNKFRKLGLIEYNGSMKVHTSLLNVIIHD
jgi:CRP/FNR family transcriptional regulator, cyclic AMP receptor protein